MFEFSSVSSLSFIYKYTTQWALHPYPTSTSISRNFTFTCTTSKPPNGRYTLTQQPHHPAGVTPLHNKYTIQWVLHTITQPSHVTSSLTQQAHHPVGKTPSLIKVHHPVGCTPEHNKHTTQWVKHPLSYKYTTHWVVHTNTTSTPTRGFDKLTRHYDSTGLK